MCGSPALTPQPSPQTPPRILTHVAPDFNANPNPFRGGEPLPNTTGRVGGPLLVAEQQKLGEKVK